MDRDREWTGQSVLVVLCGSRKEGQKAGGIVTAGRSEEGCGGFLQLWDRGGFDMFHARTGDIEEQLSHRGMDPLKQWFPVPNRRACGQGAVYTRPLYAYVLTSTMPCSKCA